MSNLLTRLKRDGTFPPWLRRAYGSRAPGMTLIMQRLLRNPNVPPEEMAFLMGCDPAVVKGLATRLRPGWKPPARKLPQRQTVEQVNTMMGLAAKRA